MTLTEVNDEMLDINEPHLYDESIRSIHFYEEQYSWSTNQHRAVQWYYINKLSNVTVLNHTFIKTNHQTLFVYNRTKITG